MCTRCPITASRNADSATFDYSLCWFLDLVLTVSKNLRAELLRKLDVDVICAEVDGISQEQNSHNWLITVL